MAKMSEKMKQEMKAEKAYNKTHKRAYKLKGSDVIFNIINYSVFAIFAIMCFFPFYYIFINTISGAEFVSGQEIMFYPKGLTIDNYVNIVKMGDLWQSFWITISRTFIGTALMVVASGVCGYLFTKQEMWHRKVWYRLFVVTMYFNAGIIPWYMNMLMLGLTDNYLAYVLPAIVSPYNIILVKTYIESIPAEMEESAFIDGAGYATIFRKIIWPLSKPILATITIFGAVGNWNSFQDSLILMKNQDLFTLQHRLYIYLNGASNLQAMAGGMSTSESASFTAQAEMKSILKYTVAMVSIIPILIVYPFLMKYFEEGIMLGAVKG